MRKKGEAAPAGVEERDGEWFVPVLRGWASKDDVDARAYLVGSNRLVELGGWDEEGLGRLLKSIAVDGGPEALLGTGYDGDDVDKMLGELEAEPRLNLPPPSFNVLVVCRDEAQQSALLVRLNAEGYDCRSLIS